jgi:hypothetical protein
VISSGERERAVFEAPRSRAAVAVELIITLALVVAKRVFGGDREGQRRGRRLEDAHLGTAGICGPARVRRELFVSDVREVRPSMRTDVVLMVHRGAARIEDWLARLAPAGLPAARAVSEPAA